MGILGAFLVGFGVGALSFYDSEMSVSYASMFWTFSLNLGCGILVVLALRKFSAEKKLRVTERTRNSQSE